MTSIVVKYHYSQRVLKWVSYETILQRFAFVHTLFVHNVHLDIHKLADDCVRV